MPTLLNAICRDFNLSKKDFDFVKLKFSNKDTVSLDRVSIRLKEVSDILIGSVGSAKKNLKKIQNYKFPKYIQHEIDIFIKIIKKLNKDFPSLELFIDPLDIDESDYHTGVIF